MGTDPTDLMALAEELLAACEDALDTVPTFAPALEGAPVRSFVSPGSPAADCCPQLTVHVVGVEEAQTHGGGLAEGRKAAFGGRINHVRLGMTLFRCVDMESQLPLQADLELAAEQVNADGWALWNHLYNMIRCEQLFEKCLGVFWEGLRSMTPEGGCCGWYLSVRVTLDGYEEPCSS
jgi:hypothetical protein